MSDFFKFEDKSIDIPFYNGKPELSLLDWLVLLTGLILFVGLLIVPIYIDGNLFSILLCLVLIIPVIYVTRGKLSLFFKKPKWGDLKLIFLCLMGYYIYTLAAVAVLTLNGIPTNANGILSADMNLIFWITVLIQLIGEELFKILILIIIMAVVYHFTRNRKLSIYLGLVMVIISFGLIHYGAYGSILQILLIQGIGSLFEMYAYIKTKNVVVTYLLHVITDAIPFIMVMIMKMYNIPIPT